MPAKACTAKISILHVMSAQAEEPTGDVRVINAHGVLEPSAQVGHTSRDKADECTCLSL
jgi:hypothetical protein